MQLKTCVYSSGLYQNAMYLPFLWHLFSKLLVTTLHTLSVHTGGPQWDAKVPVHQADRHCNNLSDQSCPSYMAATHTKSVVARKIWHVYFFHTHNDTSDLVIAHISLVRTGWLYRICCSLFHLPYYIQTSCGGLDVARILVWQSANGLWCSGRVWTLQSSPVTTATTMSKSTLTSLEWANKTDRLVSIHFVIAN